MEGLLLSATVLLLLIFLLRVLPGRWVSRRLVYGLWLLAAARLLIPVQLGSADFSLSDLASRPAPVLSAAAPDTAGDPGGDTGQEVTQPSGSGQVSPAEPPEAADAAIERTDAPSLLPWIWGAGALGLGGWFLLSNLRLYRRLRSARQRLDRPAPIPVYAAPVPSPCLFGLFRPAVYLPQSGLEEPAMERYALAHELTHYRHLDHIWSLVRLVCLALWWFHPLVWAAAWLSRRDGELACDEGVLERLGSEHRLPYGRALLQLADGRSALFSAGSAMSWNARELKARLQAVVRKRKTRVAALVLLAVLVCAAAVFVFAGPGSPAQADDSADPPAEGQGPEETDPPPAEDDGNAGAELPVFYDWLTPGEQEYLLETPREVHRLAEGPELESYALSNGVRLGMSLEEITGILGDGMTGVYYHMGDSIGFDCDNVNYSFYLTEDGDRLVSLSVYTGETVTVPALSFAPGDDIQTVLEALGSGDTPLRQWAEDVLYGSTDSDRWAALRYTTILGRYDIQITEGCLSISLSFDRENILQQIDLRVDAPPPGETVSYS